MRAPLGSLVFEVVTNVKVADVGPGPWWEKTQPTRLDELTQRQLDKLLAATLREMFLRCSDDERSDFADYVGSVVAQLPDVDNEKAPA